MADAGGKALSGTQTCVQRPGHLATVPYGGAFARVSCHPTAHLAEVAGVVTAVKQRYAL